MSYWKTKAGGALPNCTVGDAKSWAEELIDLHDTDAIVTPVAIEFVAGSRTSLELKLMRAYLSKFRLIDKGKISLEEWQDARRLAERVPVDGKPRHLGDCLIRAIAKHRKYEVSTIDRTFPR